MLDAVASDKSKNYKFTQVVPSGLLRSLFQQTLKFIHMSASGKLSGHYIKNTYAI